MDGTLQRLMSLLEKDSVSWEDAREGIICCFCVVNRAYMKDGAMAIGEDAADGRLDKLLRLLAEEVASRIGLKPGSRGVDDLRRLKAALDERLGFAVKDPAILRKHEEVIGKLFELAGSERRE